MCGIAGMWNPETGSSVDAEQDILTAMLSTIEHRGPDDQGIFVDTMSGVSLGHRRLSIVDLSPLGHQPMSSGSDRYVMVYNGEVYNHDELRKELLLRDVVFRGHSDTEVMLAAFDEWGIEASLAKFNGMFALAVWDRQRQVLTLVRDRLGIKPLYFGRVGKRFAFASELKPFRKIPNYLKSVDRNALALLMRHNYIPAPYSIQVGVFKLMPGQVLEIDASVAGGTLSDEELLSLPRPYWNMKERVEFGLSNVDSRGEQAVLETLHEKLLQAVKYRMVADVPLGAFLSGGVDSSTVVALMQAQASDSVKTFSIGFREAGYDEAVYAKKVAAHLGTQHTELYLSSKEAMSIIPQLPSMFDEPFSDSSQIPTYLVSKLARENVTVALSGDGGDESFAGYSRYFWGQRLWSRFARVPALARRMSSSVIDMSPEFWGRCLELSMRAMPKSWNVKNPAQKVRRLSELLHHGNVHDLYRDLVSHWNAPTDIVIGSREYPTALTDRDRWAGVSNNIEAMMATDLVSYLPDDILTKVDRASMAVSLEARVPLLDHNIVEYAWQIPFDLKLRDGEGKWILKQILRKYVPADLIDRPKMGFGIPVGDWMRGELRDWVDDLLSEDALRRQGYFHSAPIVRLWEQHRDGKGEHEYLLWDVLMFQAWLAEQ